MTLVAARESFIQVLLSRSGLPPAGGPPRPRPPGRVFSRNQSRSPSTGSAQAVSLRLLADHGTVTGGPCRSSKAAT
jgi:hypothetical protein